MAKIAVQTFMHSLRSQIAKEKIDDFISKHVIASRQNTFFQKNVQPRVKFDCQIPLQVTNSKFIKVWSTVNLGPHSKLPISFFRISNALCRFY